MKKAALVTVQKQMAALVRGEDLLASQPGAREVQDVPYVVLAVGGEDTTVSHMSFGVHDTLPIEGAYGCP